MTAKEKVLAVHPRSHAWQSWFRDGIWIINQSTDDSNPEIGEGPTEEAAWQNAAKSLPQPAKLSIDEPQIWVGSPEWVRREEERKMQSAVQKLREIVPVEPLPVEAKEAQIKPFYGNNECADCNGKTLITLEQAEIIRFRWITAVRDGVDSNEAVQGAVNSLLAEIAASQSEPTQVEGTYACPICGCATPHAHSNEQIAEWRAEPKPTPPTVEGVGKFFGTWPGNETDGELLAAVDEVRNSTVEAKPSPDLDAWFEAERAFRELAKIAYLHFAKHFLGKDVDANTLDNSVHVEVLSEVFEAWNAAKKAETR